VLDVPAKWSVPGLIELADAEPQDEPQAAFQIAKSREQALGALISKTVGTDTTLTRLAGSDDHFDCTSNDVT
jgi:hypothetical protein